ncbi:PAS domain-containing sensor histidine kinase [Roseovarius sp. D0-M9]|uniref:PAS domain-containing sensor histidine kinase n=1 Tax=Roseovarius sp. D0-M9 TaxID=3127117 RepID=UPI00300FDA34
MDPKRTNDTGPSQIDLGELEDLYEHAPCGYLSLDPGGCIVRVNATFRAWIGHDADELLGRRFQSLLNIAGKIYYETHFAPLLRLQGSFYEVALDLVAKNGDRIPVLVNAVERRDDDGNAISIRITVFNATDRRRYESELLATRNALSQANQELHNLNEELRATNQRLDQKNDELHAFYDSLPVGIFRADPSGQIVEASRRFCALLGVDAAEDWLSALSREDRTTISSQWQRVIRTGDPFAARFHVGREDAPKRHIQMKAIPITNSVDLTSAIVGVAEDVTEETRAEAQKRQIDRDAIVRQLTGGFAHNLNGILTVITGNLELLEDNLADRPQLHPTLNSTFVVTERAAKLVNRLLLYSGYALARWDNLEIDPHLQAIARDQASRLAAPYLLTVDLRAAGVVVELGSDMLKETIEELIANAAAAMPEGGEIHLSTRLVVADDPQDPLEIVIAVSDQGTGMDDATLDKAREPFFTQREIGKGIGLGLSFVDGLARIAFGDLKLRSEVGKGTTVELHLPVPD